jgi:hypothetical protein
MSIPCVQAAWAGRDVNERSVWRACGARVLLVPATATVGVSRRRMRVAAISGQDRRTHAAMLAAAALPPSRAFALAVLVVGSHHLHALRMVVAADFQLGLDPMQRILRIVLPVVAAHIDAPNGRIPAFVEPQWRLITQMQQARSGTESGAFFPPILESLSMRAETAGRQISVAAQCQRQRPGPSIGGKRKA